VRTVENPKPWAGWPYLLAAAGLCIAAAVAATATDGHFDFAILGDRTGGALPGVYEQAWNEAAAEHPSFLLTTGDSIEGMDDAAAQSQWQEVERTWKASHIPFYLTPGNHDIWSAASEQLFRKYAGHPPRYSFDCAQAHFTILDNSRSDDLSAEDLDYLEKDLNAHPAAAVKVIVSHRPSWLMNVGFRNPDFPLHRLARRYGVQYVIAGHIHQMLRFELEGVTYLSMPSAGGHLRLSGAYQDGWFFGHAHVDVRGRDIDFQLEELKAPRGQGRITKAAEWGMNGLLAK
jgi:predicted phosphodiesterase